MRPILPDTKATQTSQEKKLRPTVFMNIDTKISKTNGKPNQNIIKRIRYKIKCSSFQEFKVDLRAENQLIWDINRQTYDIDRKSIRQNVILIYEAKLWIT